MSTAPTLPDSIKVGPIQYKVTADPDDWMRVEHRNQTKGNYGYTEHLSATIYLNPDQTPSVQRLTLLHEVMHAAAESLMGGSDWTSLGKGREEREETIIRCWESPMLSIIRDNPALVAFLAAA